MNDIYVIHDCKNTKQPKWLSKGVPNPNYCNNAFMDIDKTNCKTYPPAWKYCKECEIKGFKNPKTRKSTKTPEQIEEFKQRMKAYRMSTLAQKKEGIKTSKCDGGINVSKDK